MLKFDDFNGKSNLILMCYTANSLVSYIKLLQLDGLECLVIAFATALYFSERYKRRNTTQKMKWIKSATWLTIFKTHQLPISFLF